MQTNPIVGLDYDTTLRLYSMYDGSSQLLGEFKTCNSKLKPVAISLSTYCLS